MSRRAAIAALLASATIAFAMTAPLESHPSPAGAEKQNTQNWSERKSFDAMLIARASSKPVPMATTTSTTVPPPTTTTSTMAPAPPPEPPASYAGASTGSINGYPCGGDLPPCFVLARESGGNPTAENPTSTASGLWQFLDGTWAGYGGYSHASHAPPDVQNEKARLTWDGGRGCFHWSAC